MEMPSAVALPFITAAAVYLSPALLRATRLPNTKSFPSHPTSFATPFAPQNTNRASKKFRDVFGVWNIFSVSCPYFAKIERLFPGRFHKSIR